MLTDERRAELRAQAKALRGAVLRKRYFVVLWTDDPQQSDDAFLEVLPEHFRHFGELEERGVMFGSGPLTPPDGSAETYEGMSVVRADSFEAARAIVEATPMVRHRLRSYELFAWDMSVGSLSLRVALKSGKIALE
ncbi:MAG TPA: YciI family protein [Candidatus Lustribacter sp.]